MLKNSFIKVFEESPQSLFSQDFTTLPLVKKLFDQYLADQNQIIIHGMDEDQVWAQLDEQIQIIFNNINQSCKKIESKALTVADQETQNQEEKYIEQDQYENLDQQMQNQEPIKEAPKKIKKQVDFKKSKKQKQREEMDEFLEFEKYMDDIEQGKRVIDEDDYDEDENLEDEEDQQDDQTQNEIEEEEEEEENGQTSQQNDNSGENSVFDQMREMEMNEEDKQDYQDIENLEKKIIQKKEWQMKGEITSKQRPVNSLIDQEVDFNVSTTQVAAQEITTKEYNLSLEEKIRRRVIDELWDDRQKIQFSQFLQENFGSKKQAFEVDTNKAQFGLGQLYEQQFISSLGLSTNTTEQKTKQQIYTLFRDVCYKLDSLSNLSFQPRGYGQQADIKVDQKEDKNQIILSKEEKVPFTVAGSTEVLPKFKSDGTTFISKDEATVEMNKRSHRQVKQRIRKIKKAKIEKGLIKKLEAKGETKFMHLQAKKGQQKLQQLNSQIKQQKSVTFEKTSNFFKNLQQHKPGFKVVNQNVIKKTVKQ